MARPVYANGEAPLRKFEQRRAHFGLRVLLLSLRDVYLVVGMPEVRGAVLVLLSMTIGGRLVAAKFFHEPIISHDFVSNLIALVGIAGVILAWKTYRSASLWNRLSTRLRTTPQTDLTLEIEYSADTNRAVAEVIHDAFLKAGWKLRFPGPVRVHVRVMDNGIIPEGILVKSYDREAMARIVDVMRSAGLIAAFNVEHADSFPKGYVTLSIYSKPGIRPNF